MSTESVVILGASFAGLNAAHYILKHVFPALPAKDGVTYNVTLVNPSKDFWWRVAGPRIAVAPQLMSPDKTFFPIEPNFAGYPAGSFTFVQAKATAVDASTKTVTVKKAGSGEETQLVYSALVIATGVSTASPIFNHNGEREELLARLEEFHKQLVDAKTVVVGGAGPVGVETVGEIGELLNGKPGFFASKPKNPKAVVTVVCAAPKMLPVLREAISKKTEQVLARLGVDVLYGTKVVTATPHGDNGKTTVQLSDGRSIEADVYLDATGVRPNSNFLPPAWLGEHGKVSCDHRTLRVTAAGPLVFVVGDVGEYTRGGVVDLPSALNVSMTNLKTDLSAHYRGNEKGPDRFFAPNLTETQFVPIGTANGVGAVNGWRVPSFMVWLIKGRDYLLSAFAKGYIDGSTVAKETKWKPEAAQAMSSG